MNVMIAEAHPETDAVGSDVLGQRMKFVVTGEINRLLAHHGKFESPLLGMNRFADPPAVDPCPHLLKLPEIDFRVEVCGEILAMAYGIDIQNIDRIDLVKILL